MEKLIDMNRRRTETRERWKLGGMLLAAVLLVSLPALLPEHNLIGHDVLFHLNRIEGIKEGLFSGQFPVRLNAVQLGGYGMPTDIFYPSIFLYFPAILRIFGVPLLASWKAFLVMVNLLTMISSWWAFSKYLRSVRTGAIATLFYLVVLYRLVDMYARAAVGEMLAMAFLPAMLLSFWMMLRRNTSYWPAVVLFMTGILQSHIITGLVTIFAAALLATASLSHLLFARGGILKATFMTFLLNLWFYAPLLYFHTHMDYVMKHIVHGSISDAIRPLHSMDFYLGSTMFFLLLFTIFFQLFRRRMRATKEFWILSGLAFGVMGVTVFPAPWEWLGNVVGVLQYPFRLAVFPAMLIPLVLAIAFSKVRHLFIVFLLALICLGGNFFWMTGNTYRAMPTRFMTAEEFIQAPPPSPMRMLELPEAVMESWFAWGNQSFRDYADEAVSPEKYEDGRSLIWKITNGVRSIHPSDRITSVERNGAEFIICYDKDARGEEERIQLPLLWYMGYAAEMDGVEYPVLRDDVSQQVSVDLPPTSGVLHIWYRGLPWFRVTDLTSFISLLGFLYILQRQWKNSINGS